MKDYLRQSVWWNEFPKNSTQTAYLRFLKTPDAPLPNPLKDVFPDVLGKDRLKTAYSDMIDGGIK